MKRFINNENIVLSIENWAKRGEKSEGSCLYRPAPVLVTSIILVSLKIKRNKKEGGV
jgi:hypothetical protein